MQEYTNHVMTSAAKSPAYERLQEFVKACGIEEMRMREGIERMEESLNGQTQKTTNIV